MPLFDFFCQDDHVTTKIVRYEDRPASVSCNDCGEDASYRPTVAKRPELKKKAPKDVKGARLTIQMFACRKCNIHWDEVVDRDDDPSPKAGRKCIECGEHAGWQPSCRIDRWSEQFPYFDRGLGVMLTNKQHRRDVCKERGLTPVEGDYDVDSIYSKWDTRVDQETEEYKEYCDHLDNHPGFKDFRIAEDRGLI